MPFQQIIDACHAPVTDFLSRPTEVVMHELPVWFNLYRIDIQKRCTLIKRPRCGEKDVLHHVPLAPGKYEYGIFTFLNMGTQDSFYILLRVFGFAETRQLPQCKVYRLIQGMQKSLPATTGVAGCLRCQYRKPVGRSWHQV